MANHVGRRLSRLIRERAYTAGALPGWDERIKGLEEQIKALKGLRVELSAARKEAKSARERLDYLDEEIKRLSAIEPTEIRPIRAMPRIMKGEHGEFGRELVRILKEQGGALEMQQIVRHMAVAFGFPLNTPEERDRIGYLVRRRLNIYRKKGAVERLPTGSSNSPGRWRWKGQAG